MSEATSPPHDDLAAARAALPKVVRVQSAGVWPALSLELDNGSSIHLEEGDHAALQPVDSDGLALLICWKPDATACAIPAALMPELAFYFPRG